MTKNNYKFIILVSKIHNIITEGGSMRQQRTITALKNHSKVISLNVFNSRLPGTELLSFPLKFPFFLITLLSTKNKKLLFSYVTLFLAPLFNIEILYWIVILFFFLIKCICLINSHKIIIDVEDLPKMQSRAYGFKVPISNFSKNLFTKIIFSLSDQVWFSSQAMADYEWRLLNLRSREKIRIVYNAGISFDHIKPLNLNNNKIKLLYAGTMKIERGIKFILDNFLALLKKNNKFELHLCGNDGEWIPNKYKSQNIIYWGKLKETEAASLAKSCDIGLIASSNLLYYKIILPAKLAFYIMAGLPVIARQDSETGRIINKYHIGITPMFTNDDFQNKILQMINSESLKKYQSNIVQIKEQFKLNNVYKKVINEI